MFNPFLISFRFLVTYMYENPDIQTQKYKCRFERCTKTFDYRASRNGHEVKKHDLNIEEEVKDQQTQSNGDHILQYQKALLSINMLLRNVNDSIREGKINTNQSNHYKITSGNLMNKNNMIYIQNKEKYKRI